MKKKAIILDLDNTIYPVSSIGEKVFGELFKMIEESGEFTGTLGEIKHQVMRQPFQKIADNFSFSEKLKNACLDHLKELQYNDAMQPFEGYDSLRKTPCKKFLVTTGFTKLQYSKIEQLNISKDFEGIYVVDPSRSELTKKDIFKKILIDHNLKEDEVLAIGDDLESEIKAAKELGIDTVLYNHNGEEPADKNMISTFKELGSYIN